MPSQKDKKSIVVSVLDFLNQIWSLRSTLEAKAWQFAKDQFVEEFPMLSNIEG